jgi:hypothetical protein
LMCVVVVHKEASITKMANAELVANE